MPAAPAPAAEVRARVMQGLIGAVLEKGYSATTIGDIASQAKISRRTLYEHFDDKEACFLACYSAIADGLIASVRQAAEASPPGLAQLHAATAVYLEVLAAAPELTRTFFTEINALGARGLKMRSDVSHRWEAYWTELITEMRDGGEHDVPAGFAIREPSPFLATAAVGAINEVVLMTLVEGEPEQTSERLSALSGPIMSLVESILLEPLALARQPAA
jgi:AcrR family transcriptional regulator